MIKKEHLRDYIIVPTLERMEIEFGPKVNSECAVNLLLGTAFQESKGGYYLKQLSGPALGIYQIEPETHTSLWDHYLAYDSGKASLIRGLSSQHINFSGDLVGNLVYQTAICRIKYWISNFDWPEEPNDIEALAKIWKKHYNTVHGAGKVSEFIDNYPSP